MDQKEVQKLKKRIQTLETELSDIKKVVSSWEASLGETSEVSMDTSARAGTAKKDSSGEFSPSSPESKIPSTNTPPKSKRSWEDWEFLLGGNWMAKIGIIAILLATGWFLDLAFTNNWVTDSAKIYIGLLFGLGFAGSSNYFALRGFRILTPALLGSGFSILYLSIFSAYRFYSYISVEEAFVYLTILSFLTMLLSRVSKSEIVFIFGYLGTFLSPILLSTGENSYRFLFTYLLISLAFFGYASRGLGWRWSPLLVLLSNWLVFLVWAFESISLSSFFFPAVFTLSVTVFFLAREIFLEKETLPGKGRNLSLVILVLALVLGLGNFYFLIDTHFSGFTNLSYLLFALIGIGFAFYAPKELYTNWHVPLLFYLSIGLLVLAIATETSDSLLTFLLVAIAFGFSYFTLENNFNENKWNHSLIASYALWTIAFFRLVFYEAQVNWTSDFFLNARFASFFFTAMGTGFLFFISRKKDSQSPHGKVYGIGSVLFLILAFLFDVKYGILDPNIRNQGYSFVLGSFAGIFLWIGFTKSISFLRKAGIFLLGLVILKFSFYDIWQLSLVVKIIAGFVLGIVLVVLGLFYEKLKSKIFGAKS